MKGDFQVLLDLDGVLVDFIRGAIEVHGLHTSAEEMYAGKPNVDIVEILNMPPAYFWKPMNEEFWSKLEWLPDGLEIVKYLENRYGQEHITLWTSPSLNHGCHDGKLRWVERHLPRYYKHNIVFGHKKWLGARPDTILIDDMDKNVKAFLSRKGKVAQPPRVWNSLHADRHKVIQKLEEHLDWADEIGPHLTEFNPRGEL
jgi:5'(3')-deoxyribonucleotidase